MKKKVLSQDDILHLAKLNKLNLTEGEIEKYWKQLEDTVEYIKNLNELKTDEIMPTYQATYRSNATFEDGAKNLRQLSQKEATKNAKNKKDGYFVVRRII